MKHFFYLLFFVLFLSSCSGKKEKSLEDSFSSFVQSNDKIVAFGSVNLKGILEKADYTKIPKLGPIISNQLVSISGSVNLEKPIYYAAEGPLNRDGVPSALYIFAESKNQDSVVTKLKSLGYEMIPEKDKSFSYFQQKEFGISVKKNLLVGAFKKDNVDFKALFTELFDQTDNAVKENKIAELIETKSDIVAGVNLEKLYLTSNTDLNKLSKDKKAIVQSMVKDSYVLNTVNFNMGELVVETKNYFSEALKKRIPLNSKSSADILKNIGSGEPRLGILMNLDFLKLKNLIAEFGFSKELQDFSDEFIGSDDTNNSFLGDIVSGQFGAVVYEELMDEGGLTPNVNVYVGLGKNGKSKIEKLKIPGINLLEKNLFDNHALFYTSVKFKPTDEQLKVPQGCENFGMKSISGYIYLNGIPMEDFDLEEEYKFIEKIDHLYFEYGADGGILKLKTIDNKTNILKQAVDQVLSQLSEMLIKLVI